MKADDLLRHYARIADAPDAVVRLRRFILDLAVRGKLVPQEPSDEPASELLKRIAAEKARQSKAGELRKSKGGEPVIAEVPFCLPISWEWVALGSIFRYDAGTKLEPKILSSDLWLLELEDVQKDTGRLIGRHLVSERTSQSTKSEFRKGDILYGKLRPYLNKVLVANEPGYSTTEIVAIRAYIPLCSEYCAMALRRQDFVEYVTRFGQGTKMPRLRTEDAIVAPFPLPPLAEQHRIVAKVDELMALCDRLEAARAEREAARDRLAAASLARLNTPDPETFHDDARFALAALPVLTTRPDQIKQLRQTILNLAVRGKLVRQNANDEPAPDLLRRLQTDRLGSDVGFLRDGTQVDEFPLGWARVELSSIASVGTGLTPSRARPEYFDPPIIPWVTSGETRESSISTTAQHISPLALKETGLRVYPPGTLLVAMYGQGKTRGQVAELKIAAATNQACAAIVLLLDDRGHRFYIKLFFEKIYEEIRALSAGGAQPNLNVGKIKSTTIPFPPIEEQQRIVAKVDELMALCDQLEASLASGEDHRRRLLEALLQQALQPADTLAAAA